METEEYEMRQRFAEQLKLLEQKDKDLLKKHETESRSLVVEEQNLLSKQRDLENKLSDLKHLNDMSTKKIKEEVEL